MGAHPIRFAFVVFGLAACALLPSARAQQATPPTPDATASPTTDSTPAAEAAPIAWPGTFAEGFEEIRKYAEKQQLDSAQKIADALLAPNSFLRWKLGVVERGGWRAHAVAMFDPLLDAAGWNGLDPDTRAEVWYAKGVVATLAKDRETAEADLWKARGMTSDASLQRDTIYDLGSLALQAGEAARAQLPEVSGKPPAPALAQPPGSSTPSAPSGAPGAPGGAQAPDPLQIAREAYLQARDRFVERLRDQWQDADCQANVELCLKRLRELDDIEKKRREEEQKKKDEQKKKKDQQKKDQDKKDKQDNKDQKDKSDDQKDQSGKDDPKKDSEKPKDEDKKKPEDKKPDPPKDEKDKEADKDKKKDAQPTEKQDEQMSQQEMTQLLDRLQRIEDEHKKIEAQLRAMRRAKVKKDW